MTGPPGMPPAQAPAGAGSTGCRLLTAAAAEGTVLQAAGDFSFSPERLPF